MRRSFLMFCVLAILLGWFGLEESKAAPPPAQGEISGVVLAFGSPASGATVQLYGGPGFGNFVAQTKTGSNGTFRFRKVAPGDYEVRAFRFGGNGPCTGSAPATVVDGQTTNVTVSMTCNPLPPF
jgi:hypothetical protein